ncbi:transcriptional regulator family: Fungal Specific TF [Penicillium sp. DV-2018c]|nr:transcriptional regulator family: Fungal Specific TF [Penicillium sp. DV-2018c]KAJ5563693.1 transcriptional regulator family: Fungal Specific TF [Penicillium sp. DV-2018c]
MSSPASPLPAPVRVSQRQPQACRECTKRKRKCDKQTPCSRCKRLNLQCSIEVVQLRRNAVQHGSEIQFLNSLLGEIPPGSSGQASVAQKIKNRIFRLETGQDPPEQAVSDAASTQQGPGTPSTAADQAPGKAPLSVTENTSNKTESSLLTAIEHLAWGRNSAGCFPHRTCACQYRKDKPLINPFPVHIPSARTESLFPSIVDARKLVEFHINHIAWHHNCFHAPTFLEQCKLYWATGRIDEPLWQALYLSVLTSTVSSVQDSAKARELVGVNLQAVQSSQQLFAAMVQTLYDSNFLENLSICSVQAIAISTEVAHNLGLSELNATLFNAAVRIAECLGIHKIQDDPTKTPQPQSIEEWDEKVEREVGKRVWCQMIIQDHFAIPFTDSYSISPMHYSTSRPMNADDDDLKDRPITIPTISTYVRVLVELAYLMPGLVDGLGPMKARKPMREQYEHILQIDQKMRGVVKKIPHFLLRPDRYKEEHIPWLAIARRSLAITAAEKIIMIHRPFLFRSFNDQNYIYTRRTCVAAALTILREHEVITREGDVSIWTHTAFAITAAVILCFEVNAIADSQRDIAQSHRDAIVGARTRLDARIHDVLAQRGVALIDAIFTADPALSSPGASNRTIDFMEILANFSTFTRINLGLDTSDTAVGGFSDAGSQDMIGTKFDEMPPWPQDINFDAWFAETFQNLPDPLQF